MKACWDFKNSDKYINTLLEDLGAIADIPEVKTGYELYGDIAFAVAEYFDKKLKPNDKWKTYRSEMDRLKYLVSSAQKGQIKLEMRWNNKEKKLCLFLWNMLSTE